MVHFREDLTGVGRGFMTIGAAIIELLLSDLGIRVFWVSHGHQTSPLPIYIYPIVWLLPGQVCKWSGLSIETG